MPLPSLPLEQGFSRVAPGVPLSWRNQQRGTEAVSPRVCRRALIGCPWSVSPPRVDQRFQDWLVFPGQWGRMPTPAEVGGRPT